MQSGEGFFISIVVSRTREYRYPLIVAKGGYMDAWHLWRRCIDRSGQGGTLAASAKTARCAWVSALYHRQRCKPSEETHSALCPMALNSTCVMLERRSPRLQALHF